MTSLHAYFHNRDQVAFQRQLAASPPTDVNTRDWLGRTVLHLACAAEARAAIEYVRMLLAQPGIDVNLQDVESHWTALHRALYNGNIAAAILLLQKGDIDTNLKDFEGYRAFDVYNTTVEDTMPNKRGTPNGHELYTWGVNRNASLGHGDTDDRTHPEQVVLWHHGVGEDSKANDKICFKLRASLVHDVQMSRLHTELLPREARRIRFLNPFLTVVLSDESHANIRACGFASGGRLGPGGGQHTQPSLLPAMKPDSKVMFTAIALGQDHTLALTSDGSVFSWGLGRFSQLGYEVPSPHIQSSPRVIAGPLRRERVRGIAACKSASACWTDTVLYTWGKNNGQLGYDKNASPVQPIPRIVAKITKPIISVALNDTAMACLLATQDVILVFNDTHSRITFPSPTHLPSGFLAYRPLQAARAVTTTRILCNENTFATISSAGEIFTFNAPTPLLPGERPLPVQPQRVWALRKQWSAVHDAALGDNRSLIICTQSGHVFVRPRGGGSKTPRFTRVAGLQRAVAVRASDTGALAALREPYQPPDIVPVGNNLAEDLARLRPYLSFTRSGHVGIRIEPKLERSVDPAASILPSVTVCEEDDDGDGNLEAEVLARDAQEVLRLWDVLAQDRIIRQRSNALGQGLYAQDRLFHGADLMLRIQGPTELPVHRIMLSARCAVLARVLDGLGSLHDRESGISVKLHSPPARGSGARPGPPRTLAETPRLAITGVHAFPVLVLLHYLYTDKLLAVGDPRLSRLTADAFAEGRLQPTEALRELQTLSRVLHLEALVDALGGAVAQRVPRPLLNVHFRAIFDVPMSVSSPDVVLRLTDRDVWTHSFVLRARSPFFESFFSDEEWTRDRWKEEGNGHGLLHVDLCHLEWRSVQYVLRFMCCGEEAEMFEQLDFVDSVDQLLSLLFDVMFAANELLLDRLLLICSSILIKYVTINNISAIYVEAASLHCPQLMDSLHQYMSVNMETLLEARLLDDLSPQLVKQVASAVQAHQAAKSPVPRLQLPSYLAASVHQHREWLAEQDIPCPIVRSQQKTQPKASPKMSRKLSQPVSPAQGKPTTPRTPLLASACEDVFCMDEALVPSLNLDEGTAADELGTTLKPGPGPWKATSTPKVYMKAILAETEEMQTSGHTKYPSTSPLTSAHRQPSKSGDGMRIAFSLPKTQGAPRLPPHSSSPSTSRVVPSPTSTSTPAWRSPSQPSNSGSSPGRAGTGQMPSRTPPRSTQLSADSARVSFSLPKTSAAPPHSSTPAISRTASTPTPTSQWRNPAVSAESSTLNPSPMGTATAQTRPRIPSQPGSTQVPETATTASALPLQKSWSTQSNPTPGPSAPAHVTWPGLGPVINPSKAKAGLTTTRNASGNAWVVPPVEPVSQPTHSAPISFAEIQQLQGQPQAVTKERRSLRDIQAEEAELQAEAEFMKWWTGEEERIRLENEALAASLVQQPQRKQQHHRGRKGRKSAATTEGESAPSPKAPRGRAAASGGRTGST